MYYQGNGQRRAGAWRDLPLTDIDRLRDPRGYLPDPGLVQAANVALALSMPLLLTGEPGTGKTLFARSLAHELGLDEPLECLVKSDTEARDLFYTYDALARFHADQKGDIWPFIEFSGLGLAILRASRNGATHELPERVRTLLGPEPVRSVVLIDEVDKAPREVPNDILNEIETMRFRLRELKSMEFRANAGLQPIVIITSNSEKALPDAFLRRCVYYHIPTPDAARLQAIVENRLGQRFVAPQLLADCVSLFDYLRKPERGIAKAPSTAELLSFVRVVHARAPSTDSLRSLDADALFACATALIKTEEDRTRLSEWLEGWRKAKKS